MIGKFIHGVLVGAVMATSGFVLTALLFPMPYADARATDLAVLPVDPVGPVDLADPADTATPPALADPVVMAQDVDLSTPVLIAPEVLPTPELPAIKPAAPEEPAGADTAKAVEIVPVAEPLAPVEAEVLQPQLAEEAVAAPEPMQPPVGPDTAALRDDVLAALATVDTALEAAATTGPAQMGAVSPDSAPAKSELPPPPPPPEPAPEMAEAAAPDETAVAAAEIDMTRLEGLPELSLPTAAPIIPDQTAPAAKVTTETESPIILADAEPPPPPPAKAPAAVRPPPPDKLPTIGAGEAAEGPSADPGPADAPKLLEENADALPGIVAPAMPGKLPAALPGLLAPADSGPEIVLVEEPNVAAEPAVLPQPGLAQSADGVIVNKLPRIGDSLPAAVVPEASSPDTAPLDRFARPFDNPAGKPLFSIVLIDQGDPSIDRVSLANLPFPVSFALDPLMPDSVAYAAIYRAAGQEVVMLATGIATGAQASDIEVAFQSMDRGLPEAVAVMELPEMVFQANRPLASLVVPVIAGQGRGLLTWDQGLNAADQVARRSKVPAAVAFRSLGGGSDDRAAIRRDLDRAAFKAAQYGQVTVVGQTLPETVAALLEWTVEGRAATVTLAPLSAILKQSIAG